MNPQRPERSFGVASEDRLVFAFLEEPPFCFRGSDGRVTGCDVELARLVLARIGAKRFETAYAEFAELMPGLRSGRWAMTTGLFITEERARTVEFSRPIWALRDGLLVADGNPFGVTGYRSLANDARLTLGVIADQAQVTTAVDLGVPCSRIRVFGTQREAAGAVRSGEIDAYASVAAAHRGFLAKYPDMALCVVEAPIEEKPPAFGAFAFARAFQELRKAVDSELVLFLGSSEHRSLMRDYGFGDADIDRVTSQT